MSFVGKQNLLKSTILATTHVETDVGPRAASKSETVVLESGCRWKMEGS